MNHDQKMGELGALELAYLDREAPLLDEHFDRAAEILRCSSDYYELAYSLRALRILGPYVADRLLPSLTQFIDSVPDRVLTLDEKLLPAPKAEYEPSSGKLTWEAFEVALAVRHSGVIELVEFLLKYASSSESELRKKAIETLAHLAAVDQWIARPDGRFDVSPQRQMMSYLHEKTDGFLLEFKPVLLDVLLNLFKPKSEHHPGSGSGMTSPSGDYLGLVEFNRGRCVRPGEGVLEMRKAAIHLLMRLYSLDPDGEVISTIFRSVSRDPDFNDIDILHLIEGDALELLEFFHDGINDTDLERSSNLEQSAFWYCYRNGTPAMKTAALSLRDAIICWPLNAAYIALTSARGWEAIDYAIRHPEIPRTPIDREEHIAIESLIAKLNEGNSAEWRDRITKISATKEIASHNLQFGRLLKAIGEERPYLGLELLRDSEQLEQYLPRLLQGLWLSDRRDEAAAIARQWIMERRYVSEIRRSMEGVAHPALEPLDRLLKA